MWACVCGSHSIHSAHLIQLLVLPPVEAHQGVGQLLPHSDINRFMPPTLSSCSSSHQLRPARELASSSHTCSPRSRLVPGTVLSRTRVMIRVTAAAVLKMEFITSGGWGWGGGLHVGACMRACMCVRVVVAGGSGAENGVHHVSGLGWAGGWVGWVWEGGLGVGMRECVCA